MRAYSGNTPETLVSTRGEKLRFRRETRQNAVDCDHNGICWE